MSNTCSLFPVFGDPWPCCLLPSHLPLPPTPLDYFEVSQVLYLKTIKNTVFITNFCEVFLLGFWYLKLPSEVFIEAVMRYILPS